MGNEHPYMPRALPDLEIPFMNRNVPLLVCVSLVLAACSKAGNIDINSGGPRTVQTQARSEPIFYNGKHYALAYSYNNAMKAFDVKVSGTTAPMRSDSQKDAVNIVSSSLAYYACPDGQRGQMVGTPRFNGGVWALQAKCG
jgi:hypothetical protein